MVVLDLVHGCSGRPGCLYVLSSPATWGPVALQPCQNVVLRIRYRRLKVLRERKVHAEVAQVRVALDQCCAVASSAYQLDPMRHDHPCRASRVGRAGAGVGHLERSHRVPGRIRAAVLKSAVVRMVVLFVVAAHLPVEPVQALQGMGAASLAQMRWSLVESLGRHCDHSECQRRM